jgi:hypothetical protein
MATRMILPFLPLTLVLVACTERAADTTPSAQSAPTSPDLPVAAAKSTPAPAPAPSNNKKDKDAVKVVARPFAWPLEQANLPTRGGTSSGAPVTLAPSPSAVWKELAGVPLGIERDRAAIKAMAGEYRTCFDFQETVPLRPGYQLSAPYFSWATERIVVIEDTPTRIVLQHQLVMRFAGQADASVVKHWRQDWTWQDSDLLRYRGRAKWRHEKIDPNEAAGTWSQAVYGVGDEPRYETFGRWSHDGEMSSWTGDRTWRPRPRREKTVRQDYDVIEGMHRITITPDGWTLWQDNRKLKLADDGTVPLDGFIAAEIGLERYQRLDGFDWKPGVDLWEQEKAEWAMVRETWHDVLAADNVHLTGEETVGVALLEAVGGEDPLAGPKAVREAVVKP